MQRQLAKWRSDFREIVKTFKEYNFAGFRVLIVSSGFSLLQSGYDVCLTPVDSSPAAIAFSSLVMSTIRVRRLDRRTMGTTRIQVPHSYIVRMVL